MLQRLRRRGAEPDAAALAQEIDELRAKNRSARDTETERRVLQARHHAGISALRSANGGGSLAEPAAETPPVGKSGLPELAPSDVTAERVRAAILSHGCLVVPGLIEREQALEMADAIDRVFDARTEHGIDGSDPEGYYAPFDPEPPYEMIERAFIAEAGDAYAADSPRLMFRYLEAFHDAGLDDVISDYLGGDAAVSANKSVLRRVRPKPAGAWHQDGAFMGDVLALNVWLSLSRCGDVAPGLDLVPRRIENIVETGTEGAIFDWSVSPAVAEREAGEAGIVRPIFEPGDAVLFDDRCLHATAVDPSMTNTRYAIESWFFAPSAFPADYAPIAL